MNKQINFNTLFSKKNVSLFVFLFVNFLFSVKYISRVTNYYLIISFLISLIYFFIWRYKRVLERFPISLSKLNFLILSIFVLGCYSAFNKIPVETLNVDRWSVITSFWDSYFNNQYVYFAKSNVGNPPGPMPFYFLLALPFYFIGELGWFSVMGVILFFIFLNYSKTSKLNITTTLILLLSSVFYLWEVVSRSNIFLNSTLVLAVLYYYLNINKLDLKNLILTGILIGLSISTRNVLVIPFIVTFVFQLKNGLIKPKQFLLLGLISLFTFVLTFFPFVYNHFEGFKIMNPFLIQSSALVPFKYTLLFIIMAFTAGFFCKSNKDIYFFSGLILFNSIIIYFLYHINLVGFQNTFFGSDADISYFILCIPFCLCYILSQHKNHSN
jgi:hypothetical protein